MTWVGSRVQFTISLVLFSIDTLIVIELVPILGIHDSSNCGGGGGLVAFLFSLGTILIWIFSLRALIKRKFELFSRISFYLFVFLIVAAPIFLANMSVSRCKGEAAFHLERMRTIQSSLKESFEKNHSYPESLEKVAPEYLNESLVSQYQYAQNATSYSLCTLVQKKYFYTLQLDSGKKLCLDSAHPKGEIIEN